MNPKVLENPTGKPVEPPHLRVAVVDVDDLVRPEQIEDFLVPIHREIPRFRVTAYTIPNRFGPITPDLRERYPWIVFGIHGFEHTFAECRSWTEQEAASKIRRALDMDYDPIFKPPNWIWEPEVEAACQRLGVIRHYHPDHPPTSTTVEGTYPHGTDRSTYTLLHTHILPSPAVPFIGADPEFKPSYLSQFSTFRTPLELLRQ